MSVWLEGYVGRVVYSSVETGYAVFKLRCHDVEVTAVGALSTLAEADDEFVALEGDWFDHPVYGRQFEVTGFLTGTPQSLEGMRLYLASSDIPGVGPSLAGRIVDAFGMETPKILAEHPERLVEVRGIGAARAQVITAKWVADEEGRTLTIALRGLGLSPRLVDRIRRFYGDKTGAVVARDPYRLAEDIRGVGFRRADEIAKKQGLALDDPGRVRAAILFVLEKGASNGHCFLPEADVSTGLADLEVPTDQLDCALQIQVDAGRVVVEDDRIWQA
ncbi:MAG: ATP-dependent RecD-like DNA helicase, partial [Proteobacteria bacterium]|nr:ATP-dependent RecD-like DNA helicase [Pseudomonadota bacterium]